MKRRPRQDIQAVTVNHNTSGYVVVALRSLYMRHADSLDLSMTIMDNESTADMASLLSYANAKKIPVQQSGVTTDTELNSHGEVLRQFVLEPSECKYYLFLDAHVCFLEDRTVDIMIAELEDADDAFGIGVRQTWNGVEEIPQNIHQAIYYDRLHPCCALVKNTDLFRTVANEIGLTGVKYCRVGGEKYLDTFELMTKVMRTHGLRHIVSSRIVYHFFSLSYDGQWMESKIKDAMNC